MFACLFAKVTHKVVSRLTISLFRFLGKFVLH